MKRRSIRFSWALTANEQVVGLYLTRRSATLAQRWAQWEPPEPSPQLMRVRRLVRPVRLRAIRATPGGGEVKIDLLTALCPFCGKQLLDKLLCHDKAIGRARARIYCSGCGRFADEDMGPTKEMREKFARDWAAKTGGVAK